MNVREKIQDRLDKLEVALKEGKHRSSRCERNEVEALIEGISKFYSVLSDEDRDFVSAARYAIADEVVWK